MANGQQLALQGRSFSDRLADIGFAAFSKYGFVGMAIFDLNTSGEFTYVGGEKNFGEFTIDLSIGSFNKWHIDAMGAAGVEKSVINFFNNMNSPLRNSVGTGIKEGMKDEQ